MFYKIFQKMRQRDFYFVFSKALYEVKASGQYLSFNNFW